MVYHTIELSSRNGGYLGAYSLSIDRSKPSIVAPYMQDHEWIKFCDDIDAALEPMGKSYRFALICFGATFCLWALIFILFGIGAIQNGVVIAVCSSTFVFAACAIIFFSIKQRESRQKMTLICKEVSNRQPSLTFELAIQHHSESLTNYIKVFLDEEAVVPTAQAVVLPSAPSEPIGAAQRMKDLESRKHLLSEEEYERTRAEILASL